MEKNKMNKNSIPTKIKNELYNAIEESRKEYLAVQKENAFLGNKSATYTRTRILDFGTMIKLLISMRGGCIDKELHEAGLNVSASAFSIICGSHPSSFFAKSITGFLCAGSSAGSDLYTILELLPVRSITFSANSIIVNSHGFPKLTGPVNPSLLFIIRHIPSTKSST